MNDHMSALPTIPKKQAEIFSEALNYENKHLQLFSSPYFVLYSATPDFQSQQKIFAISSREKSMDTFDAAVLVKAINDDEGQMPMTKCIALAQKW